MSSNNYYYTQLGIQKLEEEIALLKKAYDRAVENDLQFSETKQIFLRLKEIKQELEKLHLKLSSVDKLRFKTSNLIKTNN